MRVSVRTASDLFRLLAARKPQSPFVLFGKVLILRWRFGGGGEHVVFQRLTNQWSGEVVERLITTCCGLKFVQGLKGLRHH